MKKMLTGVCLLLGSMGVNAGGVDLALSNETANIAFVLNPHQLYDGGGAELAIGAFMSEQGDKVAHATLMARGFRMSEGTQYSVGAGMKAVYGDVSIPERLSLTKDEESVGAVALGFQVGMLLVSSRHNPIELAAEGFIAPSITSFSDAERYSELGARLQIEVVPQARAYIGYRAMRFNTNDYKDVRIDRSVHLGIKISY
jgi:hypothetical protein